MSTHVDWEFNNPKDDQGDGHLQLFEKLAEKDSKRKKTKDAKKTEDGIVRRLAKNGLIDKDKVKAAKKSSSKKKSEKKKKGSSSSSSSYHGKLTGA